MASLAHFVATRREHWTRLEALLARAEGNGLRSLNAGEIETLGREYRTVLGDLAIARRDFPDDQLTRWLNALAARAHLRVYRAPSGSAGRLGRFFTVGFAQRFRATWRYVALAAGLFFLPAVWAYLAALFDPTLRAALVPVGLRAIMEQGRTWTDVEAALRPAMAAVIFTNNLQVSFMAFAGGVFFGLGTAYVLVANGLSIGGVFGAAQHYGVAPALWAFVSGHGYLEITSILVAAAGGLLLGDALLRPGLLRRRDALAAAGRRAVDLVLGAAPVFVVAGLVEGLISPSEVPAVVKMVLGPLLWVGLMAALLLLGRDRGRRTGSAGRR